MSHEEFDVDIKETNKTRLPKFLYCPRLAPSAGIKCKHPDAETNEEDLPWQELVVGRVPLRPRESVRGICVGTSNRQKPSALLQKSVAPPLCNYQKACWDVEHGHAELPEHRGVHRLTRLMEYVYLWPHSWDAAFKVPQLFTPSSVKHSVGVEGEM